MLNDGLQDFYAITWNKQFAIWLWLTEFVHDLSARHLDERETGMTVKDGERYEARHSLGDTYGVLND
jgi:hypothetical protein